MNIILYNVGIWLYGLLVRIASPFHKKAKLFIDGRVKLFQHLSDDFSNESKPIAWFHCASLGEFEQGRPVIESFKIKYPNFKILLTFFSPSGYEIRKDYDQADYIYYLPLDRPHNVKTFLSITKPTLAFFVKYEFWANYIHQLKSEGIPILSFSAIFRSDQLFFKPWGKFYLNVLQQFDQIFVQNESSFQLLKRFQIKHSTLAGDTRFDRVAQICQNVKSFPEIDKFCQNRKVFIVGSSWPEDMKRLIPFIKKQDKLKFIIAPHEIKENDLQNIEQAIPESCIRYSDLINQTDTSCQCLIIDNVGMLSSLYQYGNYAYIGGAFGKGLHNILEAVTFGLPVFFGNQNFVKFKEATELITLKGAYVVSDFQELNQYFEQLHNDQVMYDATQKINYQYIEDNTGATDIILKYCENLLNGRKSL